MLNSVSSVVKIDKNKKVRVGRRISEQYDYIEKIKWKFSQALKLDEILVGKAIIIKVTETQRFNVQKMRNRRTSSRQAIP